MISVKRVISYILTFILSAVIIAQIVYAESTELNSQLKYIRQQKSLNVGLFNQDNNFTSKSDVTAQFKGYEAVLAVLLGKEIGEDVETNFVNLKKNEALNALDNNEVDIIISTAVYRSFDMLDYNVSYPYYTDPLTLVTKKNSNSDYLPALESSVIGVKKGTGFPVLLVKRLIDTGCTDGTDFDETRFKAQTWRKFVKFNLKENYEILFNLLDSGSIKAVLGRRSKLKAYLNEDSVFMEESFNPIEYGVISKKNSDLSDFVDKTIRKWADDGTLSRLKEEFSIEN